MHDEFYSNHYVSPFSGISQKSQKKLSRVYMFLGESQINHLSKLELYILQDRKRRLVVRESSQTRRLLLVLAIVSYIRLPIEIPRDIPFIPSILKCVQRRRVSWIRSIVPLKKKQQNGKAPNWIRYAHLRQLDLLVFRESKYFLAQREKREEKKIILYYNTIILCRTETENRGLLFRQNVLCLYKHIWR